MTNSCNSCGKTTDMMQCKKCKSVQYCSRECQVQDWQEHKTLCKRKEFARPPCDVCQGTEDDIEDVCHECGFIFCRVCCEKMDVCNHTGGIISFGSCPGCETPLYKEQEGEYEKKLENLIKEKKGDPREAQWLVRLGFTYEQSAMDDQAKKRFLRAGELGLGEGYCRLAEIHLKHQNWDEARRYYRKSADRMDVNAIHALGCEARVGYFHFQGRQSPMRPPDLKEAFRLFREGASLGDVGSYYSLACCFFTGRGTKVNAEKAVKWVQKAAEKGHAGAMINSASLYINGYGGVEQSNAQAKYWLEKALESKKGSEAQNKFARELLRKHNL